MEDYIASYTEITNRTSDTVDLLFSDTYESTRFYFENDAILKHAMFDSNFSPEDLVNIRNRLAQYLSMNPYLHSVYIINQKAGIIFSSLPGCFTFTDFYDSSVLDKFLLPDSQDYVYSRTPCVTTPGISLPANFITIVHKKTSYAGTVAGGLVANISCDYLQEMLATEYSPDTHLYITDDTDKIIFHSPLEVQAAQKLDHSLSKQIQQANGDNHLIYENGSGKYVVIFRQGSTFDFTYLSMIPFERIQNSTLQIQHFLFLLAFLLLLTGLMLAYSFTMRIYSPLYQLIGTIRRKLNKNESESPANLEYLTATCEYLLDSMQSLTRKMEPYCLNRLITHEYHSDEEILHDLQSCQLTFEQDRFLVVQFSFCHYQKMRTEYDETELARFRENIAEFLEKTYSSVISCKTALPYPEGITVLLNADSFPSERLEQIVGIAAEAIYAIHDHFDLELCAGLGMPADSLLSLSRSGRQAAFSASCQLYRTDENHPFKACIIRYSQVEKLEQGRPPYPQTFEKEILLGLKSLDEQKTTENIALFFRELTKGSPEIATLYLTQLCVPFADILSENTENEYLYDFTSLKNLLESHDTLLSRQKTLCALSVSFITHKKDEKLRREETLTEQICAWIRENYRDSSLSLESIAQSNHYSSSYLRRIFKDTLGISPTDYLMSFRVEKAKEFLCNTQLSAVQICEQIGITNPKYFYSIFKKIVGCTTSDYRRQSHHQERENML